MSKKRSKKSESSRKEKEFRERSEANDVQEYGRSCARPESSGPSDRREPDEGKSHSEKPQIEFRLVDASRPDDLPARREEARSILARLLVRLYVDRNREVKKLAG